MESGRRCHLSKHVYKRGIFDWSMTSSMRDFRLVKIQTCWSHVFKRGIFDWSKITQIQTCDEHVTYVGVVPIEIQCIQIPHKRFVVYEMYLKYVE